MRDEYDVAALNPRRNPYAERLKRQSMIPIDADVMHYFDVMSSELKVPVHTLINLYLTDCMKNKRKINLTWE